MDEGIKRTDIMLADLEERIKAMYKAASAEMSVTIREYFDLFRVRDEKYKAMVEAGEMTEADYQKWRLAQMGRGKRFEDLRDKLAERVFIANEVAAAYINDATPGIYSLNRNYAAYTIEQVHGNVGFTLWNEEAVRRLMVEDPNIMPYYPEARAVQRGIDLAYSRQQITATITSGILQGKSLAKLSTELQQRIEGMSLASALRAARTATTSAQNGGKFDSYLRANAMGIEVTKTWIATKDNRTRHSHGVLDGQKVPLNKPFISELGSKMMFPGDDRNAKPGDLYNCRCRLDKFDKPGIEAEPRLMRVRDPATGRNVLINKMTYTEWAEWKKAEDATEWEIYMKKGRNYSADQKQFEEYRKALGNKIPSNFNDFQFLKYNTPAQWKEVKKLKRNKANGN